MSAQDRTRWDAVYLERAQHTAAPALPVVFRNHEDLFPRAGAALEIACGTGASAVWLALRGLDVYAVDVSSAAVEQAHALAERNDAVVRFGVHDLDGGLPSGGPVNVLLCNKFRDPRLYPQMVDRLAPGGLLAICLLSEVGASPGRFRAVAGELRTAFADVHQIDTGEVDGLAWLLARKN